MDRYPAVHELLVEYGVDGKKKGSFDKLLKADVVILPPRRLV